MNNVVNEMFLKAFADASMNETNLVSMGIVANMCNVPIYNVIVNCMDNSKIFTVKQLANLNTIINGK